MATYCWYWLDSSVQHTITFPLQYPYWYWYGTGRVVCLQYTGRKLLLLAIYFCFFTYVMWSKNSFLHQRCGRGMAREINYLKLMLDLGFLHLVVSAPCYLRDWEQKRTLHDRFYWLLHISPEQEEQQGPTPRLRDILFFSRRCLLCIVVTSNN